MYNETLVKQPPDAYKSMHKFYTLMAMLLYMLNTHYTQYTM